ncbi:hypothetical protein [Roseibium album]|uniref:hypothetical protein n=1 Tax=Roseibium album TaxID=311410 RepID=UPI00391B95D2
MSTGQNSAEVTSFLVLFTKLKDWCDDEPYCLPELASQDEGVKSLCEELAFKALALTMSEKRKREMFASPVDPKFLSAWRDYEERYADPLGTVWLSDLLPDPIERVARGPDVDWHFAADNALEQVGAIERAIDFADEQISQDWRDFPEDFREDVEEGIRNWRDIKITTGLNLADCLRRRDLVPFVLVPRHVAAKYGKSEKLTLLKSLQQAHDAFVFGAPFAALALMRSILEAVLRDHYRVRGNDLSERIRNAGRQFPKTINEPWLERIRLRANSILHLDADKYGKLPEFDDVGLEKEIIAQLFVLRTLIEEAPTR